MNPNEGGIFVPMTPELQQSLDKLRETGHIEAVVEFPAVLCVESVEGTHWKLKTRGCNDS